MCRAIPRPVLFEHVGCAADHRGFGLANVTLRFHDHQGRTLTFNQLCFSFHDGQAILEMLRDRLKCRPDLWLAPRDLTCLNYNDGIFCIEIHEGFNILSTYRIVGFLDQFEYIMVMY